MALFARAGAAALVAAGGGLRARSVVSRVSRGALAAPTRGLSGVSSVPVRRAFFAGLFGGSTAAPAAAAGTSGTAEQARNTSTESRKPHDNAEAASDFIRDVIQKERVVVFSAMYCPFCTGAKDILQDLDVPYTVFELDKGPAEYGGVAVTPGAVRQALHQDYKQSTIPAIFINGEFVGGYSETSLLAETGELDKRLLEETD